jgi:hypothetical protein
VFVVNVWDLLLGPCDWAPLKAKLSIHVSTARRRWEPLVCESMGRATRVVWSMLGLLGVNKT